MLGPCGAQGEGLAPGSEAGVTQDLPGPPRTYQDPCDLGQEELSPTVGAQGLRRQGVGVTEGGVFRVGQCLD